MIRYFHPRLKTINALVMGLFALGLLMLLSPSPLFAQDDPPDVETSPVTMDQINVVAQEIWCPLCSGVRLDSCKLEACTQMKEVIAIKLAEGEDVDSIKAYFLEQYGPQILGEPPLEGFNWLAWILPPLALVLGGIFVWMRSRHMIRPAQATGSVAEAIPAHDDYHQRLDEELKRYG